MRADVRAGAAFPDYELADHAGQPKRHPQLEAAARADSRRSSLWNAAKSRGVPLRAILATVAVVVVAYLAGKLVYRLRDVLLLLVVAGFVALLLNRWW